MKMKLMIGLLLASVSGGAFAGVSTCEDKTTGYKLVLNFPPGGMGITRGTGRVSKSGTALETLSCVYSSGITVTLNCGTKTGYSTSAVANLSVLPLSFKGTQVASLLCK